MANPSITSSQIAIDPISGVFFFKDSNGSLVSSSLNLLQTSNTQITTEDSVEVSGDLVISGNLTVNGTTVTVNAESIIVEDKNIELANISSPSNVAADGGGITLKGTTDKTFNWSNSTGSWTSSENIDLASGKVFSINGVEVLSANAYIGSAAKWTNARVITLDGDLSGNVSIDGSANVTLTATIVANSVALGTDTTGDYVSSLVAGTGIALANNSGETSTPTISINASIDELTDVAISNAANGDFFRYNGSTWINDAINLSTDTIGDYVDHLVAGTGVIITNNSGEATTPTIAIGQSVATNANVSFNQVNAEIVGNVTGNLSGNVTGNLSGNVTGNVSGDLTGNSNGTHTGNTIGTASNALVWTNQRKITLDGDVTGDVFIDGSANVTITTTIASNSVALGSDTTGDYVANLVAGTGITITDNSGEGMTPVVKISNSYTTDMVANIANSAASVSSYADSVGNTAYSNAVTYINNRTLDDLTGVTLSNAATNDVLLYNGSAWINDDISINKISDVLTSNVLNGQILIYDATSSKWVNSIVPEITGTSVPFTRGNDTDTDFTLFHGLGTADVVVTIRSNITYEVIETRWSTTDSIGAFSNNHVTVNFTTPPATDEMNISVYGSVQSTSVIITGRLDNLSGDVQIGSVLSGDSLSYNGSKWVNRKSNITTDMGDVVISGNATGQFLKYDGNTWINSSIPTINNLNDIGDVSAATPNTGEVLQWDGANWSAVSPSKSMVGLSNVDNTTDLNKPISNAQQTALDLKANLASPTLTGTVTVPTPINGTDAATKAYVDSTVSGASISSLDDIGDVTITAAANGDYLKWNGTAFVNDDIDLGTDTVGDYVATITGGTGVTSSAATSGEGTTHTLSIGQAVGTSDNVTFAGVTADLIKVGVTAAGEIDTTSGNLTIDSAGGTVTVDDNLTVTGNLTVSGTTTSINTETLTVDDNIIVLNNNATGAPSQNAGIEIERGSSTNVVLRWNETSDKWQITNDGTTYGNIVTTADSETVTSAMITNGTIVNADINASAAIDKTKISGTAITAADTGTVTSAMITNGTIVNADINASAAIDKTKISGTAITADDTGTVTSTMIADGTIENGDINTSAAIALSKLASGTSAQVVLANSGGVPTYTTISGDITVSNTGVTAIGSGVIVNADINSSAAIAYSKLSLSNSITSDDINSSAAIEYSKLSLANTITNADINSSAAIDYSKLSLSNSITVTDLQAGAPRAGFNSTLRTVTSSNTLVSTDLAKLIVANSSSDMNITISTSATFNDGDRVDLLRAGTGEVTIVGSGITINGTPGYRLRAQWSSATLIRLNSTTWVAVGDLKV